MLHLVAIQAEHGDCLVLEHRSGGVIRRYLVDGGPDGVYAAHLRPYAEDVARDGGAFETAILSHVDNDHVIGLLDLFVALRSPPAGGLPIAGVRALWHNSFGLTGAGAGIDERVAGVFAAAGAGAGPGGGGAGAVGAGAVIASAAVMPAAAASILGHGEGNRLRQEAILLGVPINEPFPDGEIVTDTAPPLDLGGLAVRVVGPSRANLRALRREWLRWLEAHEDAVIAGEPRAAAKADRSVPNLSSVCLLVRANGRSVLLTGDARGDQVVANLEALGLVAAGATLHVNVLKLPHHGSERNVDPAFFVRITADRYVVSANGRDGNPDMATLVWLVEALRREGRKAQIVATNRTEALARLVQLYPPTDFGYRLRFRPAGASWIRVPVG